MVKVLPYTYVLNMAELRIRIRIQFAAMDPASKMQIGSPSTKKSVPNAELYQKSNLFFAYFFFKRN
jgi:hypothetical protein